MFNHEAIQEMLHVQKKMLKVLKHILCVLEVEQHNFPSGFTIHQTGENTMALTLPNPGNTLQFTATPLPAGSSLGSVVPTWTSSDTAKTTTAKTTLTVDPTGLIATVVLSSSIAVGASVTLTISATDPSDPSGATVATASITFTVGAPVAAFPTSFSIAQTA